MTGIVRQRELSSSPHCCLVDFFLRYVSSAGLPLGMDEDYAVGTLPHGVSQIFFPPSLLSPFSLLRQGLVHPRLAYNS